MAKLEGAYFDGTEPKRPARLIGGRPMHFRQRMSDSLGGRPHRLHHIGTIDAISLNRVSPCRLTPSVFYSSPCTWEALPDFPTSDSSAVSRPFFSFFANKLRDAHGRWRCGQQLPRFRGGPLLPRGGEGFFCSVHRAVLRDRLVPRSSFTGLYHFPQSNSKYLSFDTAKYKMVHFSIINFTTIIDMCQQQVSFKLIRVIRDS